MTDGDALLAAILANPEDDTARLVYADWLQENGEEERAEFIRVQCQLFKYPSELFWLENMPVEQWDGAPEVGELLRRLDPMVRRHTDLCGKFVRDCKGWSGEFIKGVLGRNWLQQSVLWQWGWSRGFIGSVEMPAADWLTHADAITARHPVREVTLTTIPDLQVLLPGVYSLPGKTRWAATTLGNNEQWRDMALRLLHAEWPRITFHLPPAPTIADELIEGFQSLHDQLADGNS